MRSELRHYQYISETLLDFVIRNKSLLLVLYSQGNSFSMIKEVKVSFTLMLMVFHPFLVCNLSLNTTHVWPVKASIWHLGWGRSLFLFPLGSACAGDELLRTALADLGGSSLVEDLDLLGVLGISFRKLETSLNSGEPGSKP